MFGWGSRCLGGLVGGAFDATPLPLLPSFGTFQKLVLFERQIDIFQSFSEAKGCQIVIKAETKVAFSQVNLYNV